MSLYSLETIFYIILQGISVLLLLCLTILILRSKSHFTKWTLFQLCISTFGNAFTNFLPAIIYGDNIDTEQVEQAPMYAIMQKISFYFLYPLELFSFALTFYLWHALVTRRLDIEKKCFWYVSGAIWIYSTVYDIILLRSVSKVDILASDLNFRPSVNPNSYYGYVIPTSVLVICATLMLGHSTVMLWRYWLTFSIHMSRRTVIKLGEAVRLFIWCLVFVIMLLLFLVPRAIRQESSATTTTCKFDSALAGTFLFLVFGTQKKAAVFLPFCYYVPPGTPQVPQFTIPDEFTEMNYSELEISQMSEVHLRQNERVIDNYDQIRSNDTSSYQSFSIE